MNNHSRAPQFGNRLPFVNIHDIDIYMHATNRTHAAWGAARRQGVSAPNNSHRRWLI